MKINTDVNNNEKIKIDIVKPRVWFSDLEIFIQNNDSLYTRYFYYMVKTCIW